MRQDENPIYCQDLVWTAAQTLALVVNSTLCLSADAPTKSLALAPCSPASASQHFSLTYNSSGTRHGDPQLVRSTGANLCVASIGSQGVGLATCSTTDKAQQWIFGMSGRICTQYGNTCLTVNIPAAPALRRLHFV
jgi:hypothetical protein